MSGKRLQGVTAVMPQIDKRQVSEIFSHSFHLSQDFDLIVFTLKTEI
jgi:hypothetical protein